MASNTMNLVGMECVWHLQRGLSRGQAVPIVGPLVISPLKFLVSLVEFVAGSAIALIAGTFGVIFQSDFLIEITFDALAHSCLGFGGALYSIGNMLSLGILGLSFEFCMGGSRW